MKIQSANFLATLTTTEVAQLTTQVKETVATGINNTKRIFTAADLWRIQKNKSSFSRTSLRSAY